MESAALPSIFGLVCLPGRQGVARLEDAVASGALAEAEGLDAARAILRVTAADSTASMLEPRARRDRSVLARGTAARCQGSARGHAEFAHRCWNTASL